ncbi:hypothetical protein LguiA_024307 [Lonicera macranthoides]
MAMSSRSSGCGSWTDPYNVLESWNPASVHPCDWLHLNCNDQCTFARLNVSDNNLEEDTSPSTSRATTYPIHWLACYLL